MKRRIFLGLDIGPGRLRAVALRRALKKNHPVLVGARSVPLEEGVLRVDLREPNVLEPEPFTRMVREMLTSLGDGEDRVALTLGAGAGLIMPVEVESPFRTQAEGESLLRWQLKKRLPADFGDIGVDYQVLEKTDAGHSRVLAGIMDAAVLEQYEVLLTEAGFNPVVINFHLLSLFNFYWSRFDFGNDFILLAIESNEIGMLYFQGGLPRFCRVRPGGTGSGRLVPELHRSMVTCHEQFPGSARASVFLHGPDPRTEALSSTVSEVFGRQVVALNPQQEMAPGLELKYCHHLAAAIGAAEGMM